jgi:hypothetical protein
MPEGRKVKPLSCARCGLGVFFENVGCTNCGAVLGFDPDTLTFASFEIDAAGAWQRVGNAEGPALKPCGNYALEKVCNWVLPADSPETLCRCCRTTQVIPALSNPENRQYWFLLEQAKRRLFYSLLSLQLPVPNKIDDPDNGLSFQFLEEMTPRDKVLTGHDNGLITLNIAEADDAKREGLRAHLHEPYRTLIGHFRHEIGHYYWDRLIADSPWIDEYRQLFGDERADYGAALQKHYAEPNPDWALQFISTYASSHPWEDWAECWAHYMHAQDGLETAAAWGLRIHRQLDSAQPVEPAPINAATPSIHQAIVEQWLPVSQFINAMDRSLGAHDSYPFVLIEPVIAKLEFIHKVVTAAVTGQVPMKFAAAPAVAEVAPEPVPAPMAN